MRDLRQLYEQDDSAWAEANADLLRAGQFGQLDIEHLLEELSDMGKSEQRAPESRLCVLLARLLKGPARSPIGIVAEYSRGDV